MKLVIVVDSSCGLTKKEAEARGWFFLPLFISIDNKEYQDGVDITSKNFFDVMKKDSVVSTSCSTPFQIEELLDKIAKKDTFVLIYSISKHLSAQYQNILMVLKKYNNVHAINSVNISFSIVQELVELEIGINNKEFTIEEGIDIIENKTPREQDNMFLVPKFTDNLVRGGRLSPSVAKIAKLLKIVPVISLKSGKLEKLDKGRIFSKTLLKITKEIYVNLNNDDSKNLTLLFCHSNNGEKESLIKEISTLTAIKNPIIEMPMPPVLSIHTGLEAININILNLKYDISQYGFDKIRGDFEDVTKI